MTQDEIIRMATEAGFQESTWNGFLERFAALVAAHEREACAKVCDAHSEFLAQAIRARGEK